MGLKIVPTHKQLLCVCVRFSCGSGGGGVIPTSVTVNCFHPREGTYAFSQHSTCNVQH